MGEPTIEVRARKAGGWIVCVTSSGPDSVLVWQRVATTTGAVRWLLPVARKVRAKVIESARAVRAGRA